jgi:hypothetical protein
MEVSGLLSGSFLAGSYGTANILTDSLNSLMADVEDFRISGCYAASSCSLLLLGMTEG